MTNNNNGTGTVVDDLTAEAERLGMYVYGSKRLNELEQLADKASPGPWWCAADSTGRECAVHANPQEHCDPDGVVMFSFYGQSCYDFTRLQTEANYEFIAATDPVVVKRLLACIRAADDMRIELDHWRNHDQAGTGPDKALSAYDTARAALEEP